MQPLPFLSSMLLPWPPDTTGPNRRRPISSGDNCRCPAVQTTLYSFLSPKKRLCTGPRLFAQRPADYPVRPGPSPSKRGFAGITYSNFNGKFWLLTHVTEASLRPEQPDAVLPCCRAAVLPCLTIPDLVGTG
jgi:hypothetical protein